MTCKKNGDSVESLEEIEVVDGDADKAAVIIMLMCATLQRLKIIDKNILHSMVRRSLP